MTELFKHGKIDNQIADGNSDTRFTFFRLEDPKGKVLQRKMRTDWNVDKTTQRQTHQGDLTTKNTKATKKIQNHLKEVRERVDLHGARRSCNYRTTRRISDDIAAGLCRSSIHARRKNLR